MALLLQLLALAGGSLLLTFGANYFIEGAYAIALRAGVSQLFIGVTLVALGTSLPEFFVSLIALIKGSSDISLGNIVGSNICNVGLILGLSALVRPVKSTKSILRFEYPLMATASVLLLIFSLNGTLGRLEGLIYLSMLFLFIWYFAFKAKNVSDQELSQDEPKSSLPRAILVALGGLVALLIGSELFIKAAVNIARLLGISELIIGLSLVALGTSLPELASTLAAVIKGKDDIALGNVVGSNLLNIVFILGVLSSVRSVPVNPQIYRFDIPVMLILTASIFPFTKFYGRIPRIGGLLLFTVYVIYIAAIYAQGRI